MFSLKFTGCPISSPREQVFVTSPLSSPKLNSPRKNFAVSAAYMDSPVATRTLVQQQSLYDVLGVSQQSDLKDIKSAYRNRVRTTHPDVVPMEHKEESTKEFLKIHAAYTTLSDPETRARYDMQLSLQSLPRLSPRGGFGGFGFDNYSYAGGSPSGSSPWGYSPSSAQSKQWKSSSKNWETDQCW